MTGQSKQDTLADMGGNWIPDSSAVKGVTAVKRHRSLTPPRKYPYRGRLALQLMTPQTKLKNGGSIIQNHETESYGIGATETLYEKSMFIGEPNRIKSSCNNLIQQQRRDMYDGPPLLRDLEVNIRYGGNPTNLQLSGDHDGMLPPAISTPDRTMVDQIHNNNMIIPTRSCTLDDRIQCRNNMVSRLPSPIPMDENNVNYYISQKINDELESFTLETDTNDFMHITTGNTQCHSHGSQLSAGLETISPSCSDTGRSPYVTISSSTRENIKVVIRLRPIDASAIPAIRIIDNVVEVQKPGNARSVLDSQRPKICKYKFDHVFDATASQIDIFEATAKELIPKVFQGNNGTVFAYGCTSAGKTYTMLGDDNNDGIVQMSIQALFDYRAEETLESDISFSFMEVYNESVFDLLSPVQRPLDIQEDNGEVRVSHLTSSKVDDLETALALLSKGMKARKRAMTDANRHSSRSHAIIQVTVDINGVRARLSFVDLAGSERSGSSDGSGDRMKESSYINQSLLALANCISTLSDTCSGRIKVKYRDSKLTLLLKNVLFSNAYVVMITAIHPGLQFLHESCNSLVYARRAKNVKVEMDVQKDCTGATDHSLALKEAHIAIALIGETINDESRDDAIRVLQATPLSGKRQLISLLNSRYHREMRKLHQWEDTERHKTGIRWTEVLRQRMDAVNRGEQFTHFEQPSTSYYNVEPDLTPEMEDSQPQSPEPSDNEFDDADVESANPQESLDSDAVIAGATKEAAPPEPPRPQNVPVDHLDDSESDTSISDISELDDKEPETKDVVIGMLDKITRPSSKRTATPMWKVKLKYGVLQGSYVVPSEDEPPSRRFAIMTLVPIPNPRVFLDISIGGRNAGRMIFELFMDKLPYTCENFRALCTGETGLGYYLRPRWYKDTPIHRIVSGFVSGYINNMHLTQMCQGGNFNTGNSYGGESIYGQYMADESYAYMHSKRGVLGMAKTRHKHSNGSQFYITFKPCSHLDNKMVVFGHLEYGDEVLDAIEEQGSMLGRPKRPVSIYNCGEIPLDCVYDPDLNNPVRKDASIYIAKTDREKPIFRKELWDREQSPKLIIPDEVYKRAHYNF
ncbi:Kinesin-like protein KIF19 [Babesia sp. Xinjiang]|uniref:Kinesin-like protein KIF19 n=1 Tax=Babesia sp. Xinjiang TaxID=462227 RepID=UPI000A228DD7|nr:Kinesin-like protein KIF19 [Babesia sp. Xinjiang]ORM39880.1 Kinesin-like protein KIF19 [Babesia sp. Xinjiang]